MISICREDSITEDVDDDQSYYMAEVNHVSKRPFDKKLSNREPYPSKDEGFIPQDNVFHLVRLHLNHSFVRDREVLVEDPPKDGEIAPIGWGDDEPYYV